MTRELKIRTGCSDFTDMIESDAYYIDKSLLIKDILEIGDDVILIPRPRRFGKTLNMSMLKEYFDITKPDNEKLFTDLKIWQCSKEIKAKRGKYPVIFLSLLDIDGKNWDECLIQMKATVSNVFNDHIYLLDSELIREHEKAKYHKILNETGSDIEYRNSLKFLSQLLYKHYNQKVIILIDEYDVPIQAAYNKYYDDAVSFIRGFMRAAFKDNSCLYKGVITGIMRVSRESIFSGLNNIGVYSILKTKLSTSFGFSEDEVRQFLDYFNIDVPFSDVKMWYDGYQFGKTSGIYNPWSILKFAMDWEDEREFGTYWVNTSSNDLIKSEIRKKDNAEIREDVLKLIEGEIIEKNIEEHFVFPELKTRKNLVWTLFLYSGYLTVVENVVEDKYKLRIPNDEVKTIFKRTVKDWFEMDINQLPELENAIDGLLKNDLQKFDSNLKKLVVGVFSYHDNTKNNEYIYHAYMLGLLAFTSNDYVVKSNRESGDGRYDIMLIPKDKSKNGIVIEIKRIDKRGDKETDDKFQKRINSKIAEAKTQIDKNKYYQDLLDLGMREENIVKVPIVFAGKTPYVKTITE